jgi:methyl-accepting chemotaxis protein
MRTIKEYEMNGKGIRSSDRAVYDKVKKLADKIQNSSETISGLKESFEKIEKLITVVRGITAKTDLLALNASIEAARAGHSGKGFAVVAHEVARLAEKSQESIQNVDAVFIELKEGMVAMTSQVDNCVGNLNEILAFMSQDSEEDSQQNRAA